MRIAQTGLLSPLPRHARVLFLDMAEPDHLDKAIRHLLPFVDGHHVVIGLGSSLIRALNAEVPGLRAMPLLDAPVTLPSTPHALWLWLRGDEPGDLLLLSHRLLQAVTPGFILAAERVLFLHHQGKDLTGYRDGTENPKGDDISSVALVQDAKPGLLGSSFLAVQTWRHDWHKLSLLKEAETDLIIGRRRQDDTEIDNAPAHAHVRRTAQEDFTPPAFIWRRSMPWVQGQEGGLLFQCFAHSLDLFEAQLRRMAGLDDGIPDALFSISQAIDGAYFWCPPMHQGHLDLRCLNY